MMLPRKHDSPMPTYTMSGWEGATARAPTDEVRKSLSPTGAQVSAILEVRDVALEGLEADVAGIEQLVRHPFASIAPAALTSLTKSILTTLRSVPKE